MTYTVVDDLRSSVSLLLDDPQDPLDLANLVVVEESPDWPGELVFGVDDAQGFYESYHDWMSRYLVLNELFSLKDFAALLKEQGWVVLFAPSARSILDRYEKWAAPLEVEGFTCPNGSHLYPYQVFTLNRALERAAHKRRSDRLWFCNWATGSGKTLFATAGAQELFNRGQIDVVLAFTMMKLKANLCQAFTDTTELDAIVVEGTKSKRTQQYAAGHDVLVLNYEKCWADYAALKELTRGKRVLWVLDEASKILSHEYQFTKTRRHLNRLIAGSTPTVWPMSAAVINHNPLRYRDVYNLTGCRDHENPLGSRREFTHRYTKSIRDLFFGTEYEWNLARLHEVRHRVAERTQAVRKTDPGVRDFFKGIQTIPFRIELSPEDRRLYKLIQNEARAAHARDENLSGHYRLLQYVTNIPVALTATGDALGATLAHDHPELVTGAHCNKLEVLLDQIEAIREQGDKVIVFSKWTNMGMLLLAPYIKARGIPYVLHYGVGQSNAESQEAQRRFREDPDITLFLSSDAGSHGLSFSEVRYVIHYEPSYSYDLMMQRSSRIDRADSKLDGMTAFVYITEDTIEERVWRVCEQRRLLAAATSGTVETLSYGPQREEKDDLAYLIFGTE